MVPFAIAGVQMHVSADGDNVSRMLRLTDLTIGRFPWVQMILFSELAPFGPLTRHATPLPGPIEQTFQAAAKKHAIWLIPGSVFELTGDATVYNTAPVINPRGEIVARYRKMFPFLPYEHGVQGGTEFCIFDVPHVGRFGLSICYDIWFPETTRSLTAAGVEVLLHPVLTGTTDRDVELAIARASAAQFQCYVFDINGLGAGGLGRSCVFDPSGTALYEAAGLEEIIPIEIDLQQVRRQREVGLRGLGQVLKSFRDRNVDFDVYRRRSGYLDSLGALATPLRGGTGGINAGEPRMLAGPGQHDVAPTPALKVESSKLNGGDQIGGLAASGGRVDDFLEGLRDDANDNQKAQKHLRNPSFLSPK
jgi:deaminated glutathione amidase